MNTDVTLKDRNVEVIVGGSWGWHECYDIEIERYEAVRWTCVTGPDGRLHEFRRGVGDEQPVNVEGVVLDLQLINVDGSRVQVTRIPSGAALSGVDDDDDGQVTALYSEEPLDASTAEFVVTVATNR